MTKKKRSERKGRRRRDTPPALQHRVPDHQMRAADLENGGPRYVLLVAADGRARRLDIPSLPHLPNQSLPCHILLDTVRRVSYTVRLECW